MTRPSGKPPSRRTPVDKVVGGCADIARLLAADRERSKTSDTALKFLARRGFAMPSDTAVLYAVVETDANRRVVCVVGVFRSAKDAEAYADAVGWPDFEVAPYRLHPSWLPPGRP